MEKLVDVLSNGQLKKLDEFRESHQKPIELRDTAMVMLGLRMGFRASDVLNLKFRDINWKKREISIIMDKTKTQITLPRPVDVGNVIYAYLRNGRPASNDQHIHDDCLHNFFMEYCIRKHHQMGDIISS